MGIGIRFDGFDTVGETIAISRRAEMVGVTGLWMTQHIGYREALVSCMAFAGATLNASVYPAAVTPYLFHPTPTAMSLGTMAEMYPGRVGVSVAVGNTLDLKESGKEPQNPVSAVEKYITDLRALWTTKPRECVTEAYILDGARMSFAPPDIPIFVTALGEEVAHAAGASADGVLLSAGFSTDFVSRCLEKFDQGAKNSGRDPAKLRNAGNIHFSVSRDGDAARENVRRKLGFLFRNRLMSENIEASGIPIDQDAIVEAVSARDLDKAASLVPDEAVEAFGVAGTPSECAAKLQVYFEAGLQEPVIQVSGSEEEKDLALQVIQEFTAG